MFFQLLNENLYKYTVGLGLEESISLYPDELAS